MAFTANYAAVYNSFSGCDIVAAFEGVLIGEIQGISVSVTREKAPLYVMGSADPIGFARGKRGISGSLVFLVLNRMALLTHMQRLASDNQDGQFYANRTEKQIYQRSFEGLGTVEPSVNEDGSVNPYREKSIPWYVDQVPPFDVLLQAENEYGQAAKMEILGLEIMNSGTGMSVDDITTDETHTYVARSVIPWYSFIDNRAGNSPTRESVTTGMEVNA